MIPPRLQWVHQIAVTSVCWPKAPGGQLSGCSNCTRLLAHERKRYVMSPVQFRHCLTVARDFVYHSPPVANHPMKVIGIFGGEPLMSPHFPAYVDTMCELLEPRHRGLWTSLDWRTYSSPVWGPAAPLVNRLLKIDPASGARRGFLNWNMHSEANQCEHHPVLVAIQDVIKEERRQWELINECWLNRDWSAAYALDAAGEPKFYFCEIAGSFDRVMNLGTGLAVEPGVWNGDLQLVPDERGILQPIGPYAAQIRGTCLRCGQALPMKQGRRDLDNRDDISPSNLQLLQISSPMVERGEYVPFTAEQCTGYEEAARAHYPGKYIKAGTPPTDPLNHQGRFHGQKKHKAGR